MARWPLGGVTPGVLTCRLPGLLLCTASWWWPRGGRGRSGYTCGLLTTAVGLEWKGEPREGEAHLIHTRVIASPSQPLWWQLESQCCVMGMCSRALATPLLGTSDDCCVLGLLHSPLALGRTQNWWPLVTSGRSSLPKVNICCRPFQRGQSSVPRSWWKGDRTAACLYINFGGGGSTFPLLYILH